LPTPRGRTRREGLSKLGGHTRFLADQSLSGDWWGVTMRSPVARGRIRAIRFDPAIDWSAIVRVDARDIPGQNTGALFDAEQPVLAADELRHMHQPVLLLAHPSRQFLRQALGAIRIETEHLPAYLDYCRDPALEHLQFGSDNVFHRTHMVRGDAGGVLASGARIVEGIYATGAQEHLYLETQAIRASFEGGDVLISGSLQCPGYVRSAVARVLGCDAAQVRVTATPVGGGFGGKEDYPSLLAAHAALLARAAGRPVRMVYDRGEDMACSTKRHAAQIRHRTAVAPGGELLAMEVDILLDAGAYATLSPIVLNRATIHACGPYRCEHVRVQGRARMTNTVPAGAFRGFGNPQVHFAVERHLDRISHELRLDPAEVRRRNLLRDGDQLPTGQAVADGVDTIALLDRALELASADAQREAYRGFNAQSTWNRRGLGMACSFHGAGLPAQVEQSIASTVAIQARPDGSVRLLTSIVEMGQGVDTVFGTLAAERLGLREDEVQLAPPDFDVVPDSGPSVASRTSMLVGRLVQQACDDLREQLGVSRDAAGETVRRRIRQCLADHPDADIRGWGRYDGGVPPAWNPATFQGVSYSAFGWAAQVAEVDVDLRTGVITLRDLVSVQDAGTLLNHALATGQVQGGVAQAAGWALCERVVTEGGAMCNTTLTDYLIPTSADLPPIRTAFAETPSAYGADGARGLGELPMVGAAAAIANAVADALGVAMDCLPVLPEAVLEATQKLIRPEQSTGA